MPLGTPRPPDAEPELSGSIQAVLRSVADGQFRARLYKVLVVATRSIRSLREIDLRHLEYMASSGEGTDLALWEEVAPAVAGSIAEVNGLLATVQEQFPPQPAAPEQDDFDLAFGPADGAPAPPVATVPTTPAERAKAAESSIHAMCEGLRAEVSRFGQRVRNPSIVADRWNLLVDLQEFRGRCRAAIGELVFSTCNAFADVTRPQIVPEHATDLADGIAVRQGVTTLTRAVGPLNARLQIAGIEQQRGPLLAIQRELDHFRASRGYLYMRAGDKRFVIQFARQLSDVFTNKTYGRVAQNHVEGFAKFLDSLAVVNRREILINHDREAFAECGQLLEAAGLHLGVGEPQRAAVKLAQAVATAQRLFGRDRFLDDYLITRLRWPLENIIDAALPAAVEELRKCLADAGATQPGAAI